MTAAARDERRRLGDDVEGSASDEATVERRIERP
jgi:hypothetical protein